MGQREILCAGYSHTFITWWNLFLVQVGFRTSVGSSACPFHRKGGGVAIFFLMSWSIRWKVVISVNDVSMTGRHSRYLQIPSTKFTAWSGRYAKSEIWSWTFPWFPICKSYGTSSGIARFQLFREKQHFFLHPKTTWAHTSLPRAGGGGTHNVLIHSENAHREGLL